MADEKEPRPKSKATLTLKKGDAAVNVDPGSESEAFYRAQGYKGEGETAAEVKEAKAGALDEHPDAAKAAKEAAEAAKAAAAKKK